MKLRTKMIIASAAAVVIAAIVLTQIIFPLCFTDDRIEYRRLTEVERTYFEYGFKQSQDDPQNLYQRFTDAEKLPSENIGDYIRENFYITCKSHSMLNVSGVMKVDSLPEKYADRCLYSMLSPVTFTAARMKQGDADAAIFIYVGGLSDDEIKELLNGFKFYVSYNIQLFGSGRQTFSLSSDDITTYDVDEEYYK